MQNNIDLNRHYGLETHRRLAAVGRANLDEQREKETAAFGWRSESPMESLARGRTLLTRSAKVHSLQKADGIRN
jgi:hypothetical protein